MATKAKTKSRVSKSTKKTGFKFRWWFAVILVLLVAVAGLLILRFTYASGTSYDVIVDSCNSTNCGIRLFSQGNSIKGTISKYVTYGGNPGYPKHTDWKMTLDNGFTACGTLYSTNSKGLNDITAPSSVKWVVTNPECGKG